MSEPKVAIVGAGGWGQNHVRVWHQLGALQVVCDRSQQRLDEALARAPGVATDRDFDAVLARDDVDACIIATPAATHASLARRALEAGKDVLVEKPLATEVTEAKRLVELAEARGRILMVGHVLVYHAAFETLLQLIARGELGRIQYIYSNRLNLGRIRTEENALWSFAPHDVSLILQIFRNPPHQVACHGEGYLDQRVADVTLSTLSFPGDVRAHIFVSWLHPFKEHRFVVVGDRQMALFDDTRPFDEKLQLFPHRVDWVDG